MTDFEFLYENINENAKSTKTPDSLQIAAITKKDNSVVSAGAGSGKTEVLALRYAFLLMSDESLHVKNILALTFTKKAAAEIYSRVYKKLNAFASSLSKEKYRKQIELAKRALDEFADAHIQTLDSYSGTIVRLAASRYGIRPDFSTGSPSCARIAENAALPFVLKHKDEECFSAYSEAGKLEEFASGYFSKIILDCTSVATKKGFFSSHFAIQQKQIKEKWNDLMNAELNGSVQFQLNKITMLADECDPKDAFAAAVQSIIPSLKNEEAPAVLSETLFEKESLFSALEKVQHVISKLNELCSINKRIGARKGKVKDLKERIAELQGSMEYLLSIHEFIKNYNHTKRMLCLLDDFLEEVNDIKRSSGNLSFKDVNDLAVRILIEQPDIRNQQKRLIKKIMIDEFQDNNKKNKDFLFLLSENDSHTTLIDNKTEDDFFAELEKNISLEKLFFVGDEKQSIYKFRGADVCVFNELKTSLKDTSGKEGNANVKMTNNYRSSPALLSSFNMMFSSKENPLNESEIPSLFYSPQDMRPYEASCTDLATKEKETLNPVTEKTVSAHICILYSGENSNGEKFSDYAENGECLSEKETEAYFIAQKINELCASDPDYSNYAILDNSRTHRFFLQRYLSLYSIPYTVDMQTNIFSEGIANDFYSFLRLCVYPSDTNAKAAFLASPFAGISRQGIQNILACADMPDQKPELSESDIKKYLRAQELYSSQREKILSQSITQSLEFLWYETGYYFETLLNKTSALYAEQFDLLYESARQAENEGKSISWFVDQLEAAKSREAIRFSEESDELNLKETSYPLEKPNAVKIMTIHQSKGLQFKHVFVTGIWKDPQNDSDPNFFFDEDGFEGQEPSGVSLRSREKIPNYFFLRQKEESHLRDLAEQKRKIYVAVTRAEESVFLVGSLDRSKALKDFDSSNDTEKAFSGSLSLMHKLSRFYYQKELYTDNDFSFKKYCDAPVFNKNGAPFDFIKIHPVSAKVRLNKEESPDEIRRKKIDIFSGIYSCIPLEESDTFPKEFSDKTQTPSGLEKGEHTAVIHLTEPYERNTAYDDIDSILSTHDSSPGQFFSEDTEEDSASSSFSYSDLGKLAHSYMEFFAATGKCKGAEESAFTDRTVAKKAAEVLNADEHSRISNILSAMCEQFKNHFLGKQLLLAKSNSRLCKAENKFKLFTDGTIFTGSMDLIFEAEDKSLVIVDYKIDRSIQPQLYVEQQSCYRKAASEIFQADMQKIRTYLYYLRYDKEIDISQFTK
ncbi:MAG: UvrD-helicase domain-containing protein [Treponema sp.]|nr:UvrD-helicase domain-containing protein [Treponema sp.]